MPPTLDEDRSAVAAIRDAWCAAVATRNPDALHDLLTDDYEVWAHGAAPIRGRESAAAAMKGALAQFEIQQAFEPVETVVAGDWAFERGIEHVTVTPVGGGATQSMSQRALLILHRGEDGRWRYARGMTNGLPATPSAG